MENQYFKFYDFEKYGKYIFQDKNNRIKNNDILPLLVFHYIVNYNLDDLELFFRLAGFNAFRREELPKTLTTTIDVPNRSHTYFNGLKGEEKDKTYIEAELGEGIIARYIKIKKNQLLYKKAQLEKQIANIEEELKNFTEPEEAVQHTFK